MKRSERTRLRKRRPDLLRPESDLNREANRVERANVWTLSLDDFGGHAPLEHGHDDFGHAFPMTKADLVRLMGQIEEVLD